MTLFILSFLAGVLTITAPCILPLLPVVVGGSLARSGDKEKRAWIRPVRITASLALSVILFTLLLKATTTFLGVPQEVWQVISGGLVLLFGVSLLFPLVWAKMVAATGLEERANKFSGTGIAKGGATGDIILGASLGPIFSSCSPTYALVVATVLPVSFFTGLSYLAAYALGLAVTLLAVAYLGQRLVKRLGWLSNPNGALRKVVGIILVIVGIAVLTGLDKDFQAFVLEQGWYDPILELEAKLR